MPHQTTPAARQPLAEGEIPTQPQAGGSATLPSGGPSNAAAMLSYHSVRSRRSAYTRCGNNQPPRGDVDDLDEEEGESTHLLSSEDKSQDFNTWIQAPITDYEANYLDQEPVQEREDANWDHQPVVEQGDSDCCLLYTSPSPRDATLSRMPSSA